MRSRTGGMSKARTLSSEVADADGQRDAIVRLYIDCCPPIIPVRKDARFGRHDARAFGARIVDDLEGHVWRSEFEKRSAEIRVMAHQISRVLSERDSSKIRCSIRTHRLVYPGDLEPREPTVPGRSGTRAPLEPTERE